MAAAELALQAFNDWYLALRTYSAAGGPARGTISAALVVLERLKEDCDTRLDAHRAPGGSQAQGASGAAAARILARFGETRPFLAEGGRTNRGGPGDISRMLDALRSSRLCEAPRQTRVQALESLQLYLVERIREWHAQKRIAFTFDPAKSAWQIVHEILREARSVGKEGPVAQYLVGAKLQARYPDLAVENFSYSTSDVQHGRAGDFLVGDTVFHVTVSPMTGVYGKCQANLRDGLRVYLVVPDRILSGARQNADSVEHGRIFVDSIEAFVGGNLDEMSTFGKRGIVREFRRLFDIYNSRVDAVESDKSMMIEIPPTLER